uniref:[RNA-polymerase]-subunit kinase n=1 Tax=Aegilops tauschii TaxID=37682 RepID=R7WB57_AEGTA
MSDLESKIAREKRWNRCQTHRTADWESKIARENATAKKERENAFRFRLQTASGAKKCHARHVVHRDIKPANILIGQEGELVKICDFGLAISLSELPPYTQAGTAFYLAPEMLLGKEDYDALVDTWSLGCVMAEMLTGKTLFLGDDDDDDDTNNEIIQLWSIFRLLGTPDDRTWPEFTSLPHTAKALQLLPPGHKQSKLRDLFPQEKLSEEGFPGVAGPPHLHPRQATDGGRGPQTPMVCCSSSRTRRGKGRRFVVSVSYSAQYVQFFQNLEYKCSKQQKSE